MFKNIEMIPALDPRSLKEKLEEMVNNGWGIKGFVCFNQGSPNAESFAVMERLTERSTETGEESVTTEPASQAEDALETETTEALRDRSKGKRTPKKNISISIGGS